MVNLVDLHTELKEINKNLNKLILVQSKILIFSLMRDGVDQKILKSVLKGLVSK